MVNLPKSQLTKNSACQKVNLPENIDSLKASTRPFWSVYAKKPTLALNDKKALVDAFSELMSSGKLTFWQVDFLPS
jgi:hypothetical protein